MFGARSYGVPSRFIAEIPAGLTDREEQAAPPRPARDGRASEPGPSSLGLGRARAGAQPPTGMGDDVVHPTFGEGVVTGVEPGGIVVIRFSADRSERKLVADLAPISKR